MATNAHARSRGACLRSQASPLTSLSPYTLLLADANNHTRTHAVRLIRKHSKRGKEAAHRQRVIFSAHHVVRRKGLTQSRVWPPAGCTSNQRLRHAHSPSRLRLHRGAPAVLLQATFPVHSHRDARRHGRKTDSKAQRHRASADFFDASQGAHPSFRVRNTMAAAPAAAAVTHHHKSNGSSLSSTKAATV